jgi:secreted trypsin-like serine protease
MLSRALLLLLPLIGTAAIAADGQPQVVGGQPVNAGQFPFIVLLVNEDNGYSCTGSLVRDDWVLTAAHCALDGVPPTHVLISDAFPGFLGSKHTADLVEVAQWIPHPDFDLTTLSNDVALIHLAAKASAHPPRLNGAPLYAPTPLQLAASPPSSDNLGNVVIAGFGLIDGGVQPPLVYWASSIPTYPIATCQAKYANPVVNTRNLCFGSYPNVCFGDSGGAVFKASGSSFVEYGIVSGSNSQCGGGPSLATYVPGYYDWIQQQISGGSGGECTPSSTRLCLLDRRFSATLRWSDGGPAGLRDAYVASAMTDSPSSAAGLFYFYQQDPNNWEILVKMLDGCGTNNAFWLLVSASTGFQWELTVRDEATGTSKTFSHPLDGKASGISDFGAFMTCGG